MPRAASRIDGGTLFKDALAAMIMVGRVIKVRTSPPTIGVERGRPKKFIKTARPKRPNMIEGTAARLLMLISIRSVSLLFGAKFLKVDGCGNADGKGECQCDEQGEKRALCGTENTCLLRLA